jgi:hypothetical protein
MPTSVEVSYVKRSAVNRSGVAGLGGMWRDRPWYLSEESLIWWIERPDKSRQWDFYVQVGHTQLSVVVSSGNEGKYLAAAGEPFMLLKLPEWPTELDRSIPS